MSAYMPKIGPGACHVFRPNGPSTSWNVALTGSCAGYLPQYVAQFNGQSSYIKIVSSSLNIPTITLTAWVNYARFTGGFQWIMSNRGAWGVGSYGTSIGYWNFGTNTAYYSTNTLTTNQWYFVPAVINAGSGTETVYINGVQWLTDPVSVSSYPQPTAIGMSYTGSPGQEYLGGSIANVQIYNTSLTANQIQYLYNEGIGGAPIYLQYLVGWWPLNGDTIDYSGNNNNGVPTNVIYSGTWTSGYYH